METQSDFKELFALLNAHDVAYLIVGAHALSFHGAPRYTGDINVYVRPDAANAERVLKALDAFGFGSLDLGMEDFTHPDCIIQLGMPPARIDFLTSISGVSWNQADAGKVAGHYGDVPVHYLGREEYIANKRSCGRKKDLADIEALGED